MAQVYCDRLKQIQPGFCTGGCEGDCSYFSFDPVVRLEPDDPRSWTMDEALEDVKEALAPGHNFTQMMVLLRDQREKEIRVISVGMSHMEKVGILQFAQHVQIDQMLNGFGDDEEEDEDGSA